jgi:hypothetical protein
MAAKKLSRRTSEAIDRGLKATRECLRGGGHSAPERNIECFCCHPFRLRELANVAKAELGLPHNVLGLV